jgi:hypothetical protein
MLTLFPGEQIITQSSDCAVTLTTHRICYEYREWGRFSEQSIMLEHITSCENYYSTQIWMLIAGVICVLGAFLEGLNHDPSLLTGGLLLALVLGFLYWLTRQNFIVISSPSTSMVIKVKIKKENVRNFVNNVEQARNKRISTLNIRASLTD